MVYTLKTLFCSFLFVYAITAAAVNHSQKIVITGASTIAPVVLEIGKRFEGAYRDQKIRVDVQTGGSSRGVADAQSGMAQIGMVSRPLKTEEKDLVATTLALDGVAIVVHAKNKIQSLSSDQLRQIFTGKIQNWRDLGGDDAKIIFINRAEGRSEVDLITQYLGLKTTEMKPTLITGENAHTVKTIADQVHGITYLSSGVAEWEQTHKSPLKSVLLDNVAPTSENIQKKNYPLTRPLNLVTKGAPEGLAKQFIQYSQSAELKSLLQEHHFVPVTH